MSRRILAVGVLGLALLAAAGGAAYQAGRPGPAMTEAAQKWLATLSGEQRSKAVMDYDAPQRVDWHFIPKASRKGLQIREMNDAQRQAARALLRASLSEIGYGKATRIMEYEALLKELEKAKTGTPLRDTERYYFTVFGQPSDTGKWGLSIEGHHMSFNFVVEQGRVVSSSPNMFGANPAIIRNPALPGFQDGARLLAKEEQLAFDLLASLDADQRKVTIIAEKALDEVRTAGAPQPPTDAPAGIAGARLNDNQKKILRSLVEAYAENMPDEVAAERLSSLRDGGLDKVHFAWAGADKPGVGHYYRVQGETFLIEFVNTQPDAAGNPANHIHCTWRDRRGDFAIPIK
ncbi:MAG: DUF3500 domain-containing protein [Pirellulales bacterium]